MFSITARFSDESRAISYKSLFMPGGEAHVTVDPALVGAQEVALYAHLPNSGAVMTLLMLTDAIRRLAPAARFVLDMPYVPYARQDRVANPGEALSIKVFASLINSQGYDEVRIRDPHSDVTSALLDRVVIENIAQYVRQAIAQIGAPVALVAPDAGARKRTFKLAAELGIRDVVCADKVRDTVTGEITGLAIEGAIPNLPLLVVDDICDGGRTFLDLAAALSAKSAGPRYLYVSHGIFSKTVTPLLECYDKLFTPMDWTFANSDRVIITSRTEQ